MTVTKTPSKINPGSVGYRPRQPRPSEVADICERAAAMIEKTEWTSDFANRLDDDAIDMFEAVLRVAPVRHWTAVRAINTQLERENYGYDFAIFDFNRDTNDKRKVVRLLRRVAREIRKGTLEPYVDAWGDQAWQGLPVR